MADIAKKSELSQNALHFFFLLNIHSVQDEKMSPFCKIYKFLPTE